VPPKEPRPLRPEEVEPFLRPCLGRRLEALFVVALDSGARLAELLALTWDDWLPESRELVLTKPSRAKVAG
jgi:integrase